MFDKMKYTLLLLIVLFLAVSCDPGEIPISPYDRGDVTTAQIELGSDYELQAYFDLGTNSFVKQNYKYDWELAFDCRDSVHRVYLNSSLLMKAHMLETEDFEAVPDPKTLDFRADHHRYLPDSMPLTKFVNSNRVAVIDLGTNRAGSSRGYKKIKVSFDDAASEYKLVYANLDGTKKNEVLLEKDDRFNTVEVNFAIGEPLQASPPKADYDLYFGQYTYQFYEPYLAYLVVGVTINPYLTQVAVDSERDFREIDQNALEVYEFNNYRDAIGYEWKYYNLDEGTFLVFPHINYIIRDAEGFYYKLHFIDFYNEAGEKGTPKFEFQRI